MHAQQAWLAQLAHIVADAPDAVLVIDGPTGRILLANAAACSLTAFDPQELPGRSHLDLYPAEARQHARAFHESVRATPGGARLATTLRRADGRPARVDLAAHGLSGDERDVVVTMLRARDDTEPAPSPRLTDLREALARMEEHNARLEQRLAERTGELAIAKQELMRSMAEANERTLALQQVSSERTRFFGGLAHEMRTPLNAVLGLADLLAEEPSLDEARQTARQIGGSARALTRLVSDLLDHSRLEAGRLELLRRPYDLCDLLGEVTGVASVQCRELGLRCELQVEGDLPERVVGDEGRVRQVLLNLLANALKFTREGGITLTVRVLERLGSRLKTEFRVTDTGIGIPGDQQATLFHPYQAPVEGPVTELGGSGMGLAICRALVERMGGRIGVESDEGWGSTFWFTLPLEPFDERDAAAARAPGAASDGGPVSVAGCTVLLVEDSPLNRQVGLGLLRRLGVVADGAENGLIALAMLAETRYDAVLMDVQMPVLDGLEATRRLRAGLAGDLSRDVPVIAMTGNVTRKDRQACRDVGMNDYVAKPVSGDRLREALVRVLTPPAAARGGSSSLSDVTLDLAGLADDLDGDRDRAAELVTRFLEQAPAQLCSLAAAASDCDGDTIVAEAAIFAEAARRAHAAQLVEQVAEVAAAARHREYEYAQALIGELTSSLDELAEAWRQAVG